MSKSLRFHQVQVGQRFKRDEQGASLVKVSKGKAHRDGSWADEPINSQALVTLVEQEEKSLDELIETDFHTFDFTPTQLKEVVDRIVQRAVDTYGADRIDAERLRKGVLRAHATNPIRLIALLRACAVDFPADVLYGIYRHYDVATDSIRGGWKAQHSDPHEPDIFDLLFGRL